MSLSFEFHMDLLYIECLKPNEYKFFSHNILKKKVIEMNSFLLESALKNIIFRYK